MLKTHESSQFSQVGRRHGGWFGGGGRFRPAGESPNERLGMASIGIGGRPERFAGCGQPWRLVAICDVDKNRLRGLEAISQGQGLPDFRKMLEEWAARSTRSRSARDHMHAPAALMAMRMGIHCFCQKPLTRTIYEARLVGQVAGKEAGHADGQPGKAAMRCGDRPIGSRTRRSARSATAHLDGSCEGWWPRASIARRRASRPSTSPGTSGSALPRSGRMPTASPVQMARLVGLGTGRSGYRLPFGEHAVHGARFAESDLGGGRRPRAQQGQLPRVSIITYEFAATDARPALKLVWYDGGKLPSKELLAGREPSPKGGSLAIGEKGILLNDQLLDRGEPVDVEFPARRPFRGVDPRDQDRRTGDVELPRLRRPIDEGDARRQFVGLVRPEGRVGRRQHEGQERTRPRVAIKRSTARDIRWTRERKKWGRRPWRPGNGMAAPAVPKPELGNEMKAWERGEGLERAGSAGRSQAELWNE